MKGDCDCDCDCDPKIFDVGVEIYVFDENSPLETRAPGVGVGLPDANENGVLGVGVGVFEANSPLDAGAVGVAGGFAGLM